jgi:hypothetical protein
MLLADLLAVPLLFAARDMMDRKKSCRDDSAAATVAAMTPG